MTIIGVLLPELEKASEGSEFKIMSYKFEYKAWDPKNKFYNKIKELLEDEDISVKLLGGMPNKELYRSSLKSLFELGAEIRILEEPPTSHVFIHNSLNGKKFIWFEFEHKNEQAICVSYTKYPSQNDLGFANNYFDVEWKKAMPFDKFKTSL